MPAPQSSRLHPRSSIRFGEYDIDRDRTVTPIGLSRDTVQAIDLERNGRRRPVR